MDVGLFDLVDVGLCQWWVWDVGLFDLVCGFVNVVGCCGFFIYLFILLF